ncbi:MAG TPA: DoxX family protein [Candidatus Koribacter sp.]|jgi:putative oxidoreductase
MSASQLVNNAYRLLVRVGNALQSTLLLLVRLYWGWQFAQSGWGRLHNLGRATDFFTSLGVPLPHFTVICISSLELVGGILLAVGLGSRLVGLLLAGDMTVAYLTAARDAIAAIFSDPGKFYNADPYTFWFASILVFCFGPGDYSLEALIEKRRAKNGSQTSAVARNV